jgi:glyoxylase-like metal-dependent hydrolase (beta-lactamase superfamily II)
MMKIACCELLPGLWRFEDTCNVYVVTDGDRALAIDFGSGAWLANLTAIGVKRLDTVILTHHHGDQCAGLAKKPEWPFAIHAPAGEETFLDPARADAIKPAPWLGDGCPASYMPPKERIPGITYDIAGDVHFFWAGRRIRAIHTPGHGPNACSLVIDHDGRQVVFCGDAAHADATVWQPFHLEWDHWTGSGALAAWEGVERLLGAGVDLLCPSHGPVVADRPRAMLPALSGRLLDFYRAKGQISPGENDRYLRPMETMACGALRYLPSLYQFGGNGYLLMSASDEGLVVDPQMGDMPALEALLAELAERGQAVQPTAMVVSHYHYDHCDAIPYLQERYGAKAWLHPTIAEPWKKPAKAFLPWLLDMPIKADHLWPDSGEWQWNEYAFHIAHWPGQTWGHCAFMASIDGKRVFFAGDSFVPSSRWNGTGGFCAYNNSRFAEGYIPSARLALDWRPDIMAGGHGNCYEFAASKFRKIIRWAGSAEQAVRALCPTGDLETDYYVVRDVVKALTTKTRSHEERPELRR